MGGNTRLMCFVCKVRTKAAKHGQEKKLTINIRPHHLLDVYKLYGRGIYPLSPDNEYGHDVYLIGNLLINHKVDSVILVNTADDICKPCKYYENGICIDSLHIGEFKRKHDYNCFIDQKLLQYLQLGENTLYNLNALLSIIIETASLEMFCKIWSLSDDNKLRFADTLAGIKKFCSMDSTLPGSQNH